MAAVGGLLREFCEEATCSVCLEYFTDPVIAECGHNFCRACLAQSTGEPGGNASCPECREPLQQGSLRPNRKLASIADISKKIGPPEAKGAGGAREGECERHQEPLSLFCRDDEVPICVVCERSKEHRQHLVIPLEEAAEERKAMYSAGGVCETHQEPLKLFCRNEEAPICVVCGRSEEHKGHQVIPMDEAVEEYKEKIQVQLHSLEKKRKKAVKQKMSEELRSQKRLKQLEEETLQISPVFKEMHTLLEEKERFWLKAMSGLEKQMKKRQEENMTRLSNEISQFNNLIKDVEGKCQQPPSAFLQDASSTLSRCLKRAIRPSLELSSGLEWRFKSDTLKTSVLKEVVEEFEGSLKRSLSKVSVSLDPDTAYSYLILAEDPKSVRRGNSRQNLPDNPERFSCMSCVLGRERFNSGRHCWEVEVEVSPWTGEQWAVGVAGDAINRKDYIALSSDNGIWAVGKNSPKPHALRAYTSPEQTLLALSSDVRKIRVFLDYEEGRVEFFDADTDNWIFSFSPASFSGEEIRPFFSIASLGTGMKC